MKKIIILLVILLAISYIFINQNKAPKVSVINVSDCSIMQDTCHVNINDSSSVSFDVNPKGLPPTKTATAIVQLNKIQASKIEVLFTSTELGYSSPKINLNKINDKTFNGSIYLSLCALQKVNWIAYLTIYTDANTWKIAFPFVHSGDGYDIINPYDSTNK